MKFSTPLLVLLMCMTVLCGPSSEDRLQTLCDSLLTGLPDSMEKARLAVLPFTGNMDKKDSSTGRAIAEYIIVCVQKDKRLKLVDRAEFQRIMMELNFSESDMVDPAKVLQAGKLMTANYLLTGTVTTAFGMNRVSAKIIKTETSEIISAASVSVAPVELEGFTRELFGEKAQISASVYRSLVVPGWGQFYSRKYVRGGTSLVFCLGSLATTLVLSMQAADKNNEWSDYQATYGNSEHPTVNATAEAARRAGTSTGTAYYEALADVTGKTNNLYDDYSKSFDRVVIAGAVTGGLWALNLLDAAIAGMQEKNHFRPYFSAGIGGVVETGLVIRF